MREVGLFRIGILALGNLMRTDDAVAMLTLRRLVEDGRLPQDVPAIEGGTLGLDLLDQVYGMSHLLALDAVDIGAAPGTLVRFAGQELADLPVSKSVHLLGFSDLLNVLRLMGAAPKDVVLLGVQPESTDWGTALTQSVEAAKGKLAEEALDQIAAWATEISAILHSPVPSAHFSGDLPNRAPTNFAKVSKSEQNASAPNGILPLNSCNGPEPWCKPQDFLIAL